MNKSKWGYIIVIIILLIACGVLSYLLYQNINKPCKCDCETNIVTDDNINLSNYLGYWVDGDSLANYVNITNEDNKIQVEISIYRLTVIDAIATQEDNKLILTNADTEDENELKGTVTLENNKIIVDITSWPNNEEDAPNPTEYTTHYTKEDYEAKVASASTSVRESNVGTWKNDSSNDYIEIVSYDEETDWLKINLFISGLGEYQGITTETHTEAADGYEFVLIKDGTEINGTVRCYDDYIEVEINNSTYKFDLKE